LRRVTPTSVQSQPVINEVMADNPTTIANGGLFFGLD